MHLCDPEKNLPDRPYLCILCCNVSEQGSLVGFAGRARCHILDRGFAFGVIFPSNDDLIVGNIFDWLDLDEPTHEHILHYVALSHSA
jgi:hypothetical protein